MTVATFSEIVEQLYRNRIDEKRKKKREERIKKLKNILNEKK